MPRPSLVPWAAPPAQHWRPGQQRRLHAAQRPPNVVAFHNGQDSKNWKFVGNITDVPGSHDAAVIPTGTGAQYYDGPGIYNGDTTHTKFVAGQQATSVGDSLCESGAFGGVICGFRVSQLNVTLPDPDYPSQTWTALALATQSSGNFPIPGDSGGPWFSLDGCCTHVWAKGTRRAAVTAGPRMAGRAVHPTSRARTRRRAHRPR